MTDENGELVLNNIGYMSANSGYFYDQAADQMSIFSAVEDALNLLFVGDTNRVVCETPSNDASTRSHCIFTVGDKCRHSYEYYYIYYYDTV